MAVAATGLFVPATADAATTVTLTGDDGNPAPLVAGSAPTIRNMSATSAVQVTTDATVKSWKYTVTAPDGGQSVSGLCWSSPINDDERVAYRGNGTYTLTVSTYTAAGCSTGPRPVQTYSWNVQASVSIPQPPVLATRPPGTSVTNTHLLDFAGNPGAQNYEIRFAKGAVLAPDGSISGPSTTAITDTAGKIRFWNFDGPGQYTMVARAQSGDYFTPWSAPVTITLIAPFDLLSTSFPDSRGPSYQLRGVVRERTLAGSRVTVSVARGKKGKRFRTLGKPKVTSKGVFKLRFRLSRGTYRLRYSYRGSSTVARGTVYEVIRIRRIIG